MLLFKSAAYNSGSCDYFYLLLKVTSKIGSNSGKYFIRQQVSLADVTGFVEERMNGQRVVKVFNHEDKSKEEFDKLNEALFESSANANKYGNMMGPVIGNIGNLQFVLTAVLGGLLSVTGVGGITLGVMAFLFTVHQELYPAIHAGGTAVQRHRYGTCRCRTYLQAH